MGFNILGLVLIATVMLYTTSASTPANEAQWSEILRKCGALPESGTTFRIPVSLDSDCRTFSRCPDPFFVRPFIEYCAPGLLFDMDMRMCNYAHLIDCNANGLADPCSGKPNGYNLDVSQSTENQTAIIQCFEGRTVGGALCDICSQYVSTTEGCTPIPNCDRTQFGQNIDCHLEMNPSNSQQYFAIGAETRTLMDCAEGTVFSEAECNCVFENV